MWADGLIGSRSSLNRMSRRQPILSQYAPACPNSSGLGASYACDAAMPIARISVSANENTTSPGATSRMKS